MSMQACETFADAVLQQLLRPPLAALAAMTFHLSDSQYAALEVRSPTAAVVLKTQVP